MNSIRNGELGLVRVVLTISCFNVDYNFNTNQYFTTWENHLLYLMYLNLIRLILFVDSLFFCFVLVAVVVCLCVWLSYSAHTWSFLLCIFRSAILCQQTQQRVTLTSCFFRASPAIPMLHFRHSVMFLPLQPVPLQHACLSLDDPSGAHSALAWDVCCFLTRLPHLHHDFIITNIHYQFEFFNCCTSPPTKSLLPFCLSLHSLYLLM